MVIVEKVSTVVLGIVVAEEAAEFVAIGVDAAGTTRTAAVLGMVIIEKVLTVVIRIVVTEEAVEFVAAVVIGVNAAWKAMVLGMVIIEKLMDMSVVDAIPDGVAMVTGIVIVVVTVASEAANVILDEMVTGGVIVEVTMASEEEAGVISDETPMITLGTGSAMILGTRTSGTVAQSCITTVSPDVMVGVCMRVMF
ncbi:hypothetical protein L208DRAFT_1375797 [Tricholoma matsutake]|nr:hypothetical protein L208DRAFT_1375797 [Tricholoma matsutake 945]